MEGSFIYNSLGFSQAVVESMVGGLIATGIIGLIVAVLEIIALWRIFKKAGKHGWAAIIPIYNLVVLFNVAGMSGWWTLAVFGLSFVSGLAVTISNHGDVTSGSVLNIIAWICSVILYVYLYMRLARGFQKGAWFTLGLIILNPLFMLILGLGGSKYNKKALAEDNF